MGTYYTTGASKADIVAELKREYQTIKACVRGNVMYAIVRGSTHPTVIGVFLLSKAGGDWGYKPMDESVGPFYWNCPLAYLNEVPDPREGYSTKWRENVRRVARGEAAIIE